MKIAAICAYPASNNPGMLSVDMALQQFLARHGLAAEFDLFNISEEVVFGASGALPGVRHRKLTDQSELEGYDRIIYWGDFLHTRRYMVRELGIMVAADRGKGAEVFDRALRLMLLEGAPDVLLKKVICFGGTIYINRAQDDADIRYRDAIRRLYSNARLVQMRDPISASMAQIYGAKGNTLGVDAALLIGSGGTPDLTGPVGYSFGRVGVHRPIRLLLRPFARRLAKTLGRKAVDIEWLDVDERDAAGSLDKRIAAIWGCSLIVTDTYHCAITAWREGVPAIALGLGAENRVSTLADKKKELFFSMFGAQAFYAYLEDLRWPPGGGALARQYAEVARDTAAIEAVRTNIAISTAAAGQRLLQALTD